MPPRLPLEHARRLALHAQGLARAARRRARACRTWWRGWAACSWTRWAWWRARRCWCCARGCAVAPTTATPGRWSGPPTATASLFDYWCHEASLCHVDDLPLHRWAMRTYVERLTPGAGAPGGLAGGQRRVRGAPGRGPPRARARARAGAGGPLGRGVGVGALDRRGVLAPDHRADAGPAVDDRPRGRRRAGRPGAPVGRVRALRARCPSPSRWSRTRWCAAPRCARWGCWAWRARPHITAHFTRRRYPGAAGARWPQLEARGRPGARGRRGPARRVVGAARGPGAGLVAWSPAAGRWRCRRSTT